MPDPAGLDALRDAIRHLHGCEAVFVEDVPVRETFEGAEVWSGDVAVFDLVGHPKAKRCYAWSERTTGIKRRFFAALHAPPVDGPAAAVRASIVADARAVRN